tara:strand:- start:469 stop:573 length:105 start_codon:yes stop_codon:yes gene_type:complete
MAALTDFYRTFGGLLNANKFENTAKLLSVQAAQK